MKVYEKYLITEAMTFQKAVNRIKKFIPSVTSDVEYKKAMSYWTDIIKKFKDDYNEETAKLIGNLMKMAKQRIS